MTVVEAVAGRYLPRTRSGRVLAVAAAVDAVGTGLFLALIPVFVVTQLGVDPVQVGVVVGLANLLGLFAPVPAGLAADRFGAGTLWVVLLVARAVGYSGFLLVDTLTGYAVLTCALALLDRASTPVQQAFVVQVEPPEERSRSMAVLRTVRNAGLSVGLLGSGVVISIGGLSAFLTGFAINALSYLVLAVAVRGLDRERRTGPVDASAPGPGAGPGAGPVSGTAEDSSEPDPHHSPARDGGGVWRDRRYLLLSFGNMLLTLHDSMLFTLLPLWIVVKTAVPEAAVGPLLAVNTVLTVLLQVPLTRWAEGVPLARRTVVRSLLPLAGSCVLFAAAEPSGAVVATTLAVLAVLALTLGENMHSVAAFELSHRLAPERGMGGYLGVFNLGWSAQVAVGPPFMTAVVLRGVVGWGALVGVFVVGVVSMAVGAATGRRC
jgi:MFS family permease